MKSAFPQEVEAAMHQRPYIIIMCPQWDDNGWGITWKMSISGFLDRSGPATKTAFLQVAEAAMHQRPYYYY